MNGNATRMLFAAVGLSVFAAVLASTANARVPEGTGIRLTPQTVVARPTVPDLGHGIGVDPSPCAGLTRDRGFSSVVPLRAGAPVVRSNGSRLFVWPTHGTLAHRRAARMAGHGDPEAQSFVSCQSDINPFDAR